MSFGQSLLIVVSSKALRSLYVTGCSGGKSHKINATWRSGWGESIVIAQTLSLGSKESVTSVYIALLVQLKHFQS